MEGRVFVVRGGTFPAMTTSWWGGNPKKNPDAREHREGKPRAKKDRKRWCKGRPGVEHGPLILVPSTDHLHVCKPRPEWARGWRPSTLENMGPEFWCFHREVCQTCGRIMRSHIPWADCPDRPQQTG